MKKIIVVHVVESLGGGVYSYFCDLTQIFGQDSRVQTTIIYSDKRSEIIPSNVRKEFHENIKLELIDMQEKIDPVSDWKSILKLRQLFKKIKPDVIHLHSSKAGVLGKIASKKIGARVLLYYTAHGYSFLRKDISKFQKFIFYAIEKLMASYNECTTIACGDTEMFYAQKLHRNVKLIRNGVKYEEIVKNKKRKIKKTLTIGILGRISYARNPKFFNDIAIKLPEIQFKWIGDGNLREHINSKNIDITGWFMKRKDGLDNLNAIDIYLQTSLWEGLPIAVLEAMALEKPVIATNVIGNKDIVVDGKTGFLINNITQALNAIEKLKCQKLRNEMGKNGSLRVEKYFNSTKNFQSLINLYLEEYSNKY